MVDKLQEITPQQAEDDDPVKSEMCIGMNSTMMMTLPSNVVTGM